MAQASGAGRAIVAIVAGVVLILAGSAIMVSSIDGDAVFLRLLAGIAVAAVGAVFIGTYLRRGLVGDRSRTCPGCGDPIVAGAERCPNCGHVFAGDR